MGNNNGACFLRLRGSLPFPSNIQLGTDATINMKSYITHSDDGTSAENAQVLYTVEGSNCKLVLRRVVCNGNVNALGFVLHDSVICSGQKKLSFSIFKDGTDFLNVFHSDKYSNLWTKTRKNFDAWDGVTDTKVCLYGTANRCGLLVLECKNDCPYQRDAKAVTIAHYFVSSNGSVAVNRSSESTDIGFSVVTKVRRCDGKYEIIVEGPEPHPVFALLHMFDEVNRSGIWKPTMCPHCRNIQREHSTMFLPSDSEDDVVPLPPRLGNQRNAATIANDGRFRGHANGSYIRCRNFYGFN
ncbi:hypothetical protein LR48_Vigan10g014700 [Vigna angularis]|uniref:Uncharacterized protein n=2 Tax=Phaseolus angularis TaxID=3914 RepID=A0A0L9VGQ8_PHAAN|nr:uncharacterized protein HKW66_Vig0123610 [Vigna angularis]KOM54255.1 hypothetical protein LR48_Vigan10g014700 [Vigna angularis]BAU02865.1 hypothetical protein VIGAN_11246000 [Vigna angularis var. angularis]